MYENINTVELIGLLAGSLISISALPKVIEIGRRLEKARHESIIRNGLLVLGNGIWVAYGLLAVAPAISIMCSIAFFTNGFVLVSAIKVRTGKPAITYYGAVKTSDDAVTCASSKITSSHWFVRRNRNPS